MENVVNSVGVYGGLFAVVFFFPWSLSGTLDAQINHSIYDGNPCRADKGGILQHL